MSSQIAEMIFGQFISDINNSKSETLLNPCDNEKETEPSDEITKDFLDKNIIDLSFLDLNTNDPEENYINQKYPINPVFNANNQQYYNENLIPNNYYYYQQIATLNNSMHNHQQNENRVNKKNSQLNPKKKIIDKSCLINISDIKTDKEKRTTVRMMNIPSYFTPPDLAKKLDEKFGISPKKENRVYDFIYIPFKKSKNGEELKNAGYAFINFVHPKHIIKFYSFFQGKHLKLKTSGKICLITFAMKQENNMKNKNMEANSQGKCMYFSDTKNHFELLTD
jgi:hypothetical protein